MIPLKDTVRAHSFPMVNWLLIGLNIFMFLVEVSLGTRAELFITALGVVPARLLAVPSLGQVITIFSSSSIQERA